MQEITHICPSSEELISSRVIICRANTCEEIFYNKGHYVMHLRKRHKLEYNDESNLNCLYHCPMVECVYNLNNDKNSGFKKMKYLKQHYKKVHMEKNFDCKECNKRFHKQTDLDYHKDQNCGKQYICADCNYSYDSNEGLLTHCRRKGHNASSVQSKRKDKRKLVKRLQKGTQINETSLEDSTAITKRMDKSVQAHSSSVAPDSEINLSSAVDYSKEFDDIQRFLRNNETQTYDIFNDMLVQSANTYTQTNDDMLAEDLLCLNDIQTQTNWSSFDGTDDNQQYTTTETGTETSAYDDLLVSTETQTSFTQCLLNSYTSTDELYSTQYTQTCDTLLEGLFDGNDFIGGLQSTYTQT